MNRLLLLFILFSTALVGQKPANKWYFGHQCGINFTDLKDVRPIRGYTGHDDYRNQTNGTVVMSNEEGDVLFYSDGRMIMNGRYSYVEDMLFNNLDSDQKAAVNIPGSDRYYIFHSRGNNTGTVAWYYTEVTASTKRNCKLISKNNIFVEGKYMQAITVVPHRNMEDYWVVLHTAFGEANEYHSFLIDSTGINKKVVSSGEYKIPKLIWDLKSPNGCMVSNNRYTQLATTFHQNGEGKGECELVNFNNATGKVTGVAAHLTNLENRREVYGVRFSPNDSLLYVTEKETHKLHQFPVYKNHPDSINRGKLTLTVPETALFGQIQRGPDDKLYFNCHVMKENRHAIPAMRGPQGYSYIGVINEPNKVGKEANVVGEFLEYDRSFYMYVDYGMPSLRKYHKAPPKEKVIEQPKDTIVAIIDTVVEVKENDIHSAQKGDTINFNNITFKINSSELTTESKKVLDEVAGFLREHFQLNIQINGHTDDIGGEQANLSLSSKRAESVLNYLVEKGIQKERLTSQGFGETRPLVQNDSKENRAKNRRVEFVVK